MNVETMETIANQILMWCINKYGFSKHYGNVTVGLEVQHEPDVGPKNTYGEFDSEEATIYLYTKTNRTVRCLVNTVIHEYQHYLQSPIWLGRYLKVYGGGRKNPYQRLAEQVAARDTNECMLDLGLKKEKRHGVHHKQQRH